MNTNNFPSWPNFIHSQVTLWREGNESEKKVLRAILLRHRAATAIRKVQSQGKAQALLPTRGTVVNNEEIKQAVKPTAWQGKPHRESFYNDLWRISKHISTINLSL